MAAISRELTVRGAENLEYPVIIGADLLADALPQFIAERNFKRVAVITNDTLAPLYGDALASRLGGFVISVADGEQHKHAGTIQQMYDGLLAHGADRHTLVLALGGGVIGDMVGFVAASFMRGVALIQVPTSLLAMVDSSIGGKTGYDVPQGKNLIGAFKDPIAVFADTSTLRTLPEVEFRCGMAETIKSALIADPALLEQLETHGADPIDSTIQRAAAVKIGIVNEDRTEQGIRAYLNLGHTFAHPLETISNYQWKHGEAVGLGLLAAAHLSEAMEVCAPGLADRVERILTRFELSTRYSDYDPEHWWNAMRHDKKWREGSARFVLMRAVGDITIEDNVPRDAVLDVLRRLRQ